MRSRDVDEKDLAVVAGMAGLSLSPERCKAVRPMFEGVRELIATIEALDVGETPPAAAFDPRWSASS